MSMNYDNELREQISALESLLNELDNEMAMEGLFSKPKSADQMIAKVKKNISKKCKTVEDCDDMLAKLKNEEEKFNSALTTMKDAAGQFTNGEIDKNELKKIIKPAVSDLKKTCNIISLKDINEDTDNVTDEEIQKLHDFLVGTREAIDERKKELSGNDDVAEESFMNGYLNDEMTVATEAVRNAKNVMEGALTTLRNAVISFCSRCANKCLDKMNAADKDNDPKKKAFWKNFYEKFRKIAKNCEKANSEAEIKARQKEANATKDQMEKAAPTIVGESFTITDDPYFNMLEAASEAYATSKEEYETAQLESFIKDDSLDSKMTVTTESVDEAAVIGTTVGLYAAMIALAVGLPSLKGGSEFSESKYIKMLNKEIKPKIKEAKQEIKDGKKNHDYDKIIAGCKKVIAINEKIKKSIEELGKDVKASITKNSDGTSSEKFYKEYGMKAQAALNKADDEIDKMKADIKIFEMKKKQQNNSDDDAVTEAYIAGFTRALSAMDDVDDDIAGVANEGIQSFLAELL